MKTTPVWFTFAQIVGLTALGLGGFLVPYIYLNINPEVLVELLVAGSHRERQILLWLLVVGAEGSLYVLGFVWLVVRVVDQYRLFCRDFRCRYKLIRRWEQLWLPLLGLLLIIVVLCFLGRIFTLYVANAMEFAASDTFPPETLGRIDISEIRELWFPFVVALLSVGGMYICSLLASAMNNTRFQLSMRVRAYRRLKRQQDQFLILAGAILGLSVLAATQLIRAYTECRLFKIADDYVYIHAGFFSIGLGIAFFTARQPLHRIGQSLKNEIVLLPYTSDPLPWIEYSKKNQQISALLELHGYSLSSFKEGLA